MSLIVAGSIVDSIIDGPWLRTVLSWSMAWGGNLSWVKRCATALSLSVIGITRVLITA